MNTKLQLSGEEQSFLSFMQLRHSRANPRFRLDMSDEEFGLATQLVQKGLLEKEFVDELIEDDYSYYAAPHGEWFNPNLNDEQQAFLYHMQQKHGLTSPFLRSDMTSYELDLARQLVELGLLVEEYAAASASQVPLGYAAPQPSSYYQQQPGPILEYGQAPAPKYGS